MKGGNNPEIILYVMLLLLAGSHKTELKTKISAFATLKLQRIHLLIIYSFSLVRTSSNVSTKVPFDVYDVSLM